MHTKADMGGRSIHIIMEEIYEILKQDEEMSIRQLSIKVGSQWITIEKALESMKRLNVAKERFGDESNRKIRLFSLKNRGQNANL